MGYSKIDLIFKPTHVLGISNHFSISLCILDGLRDTHVVYAFNNSDGAHSEIYMTECLYKESGEPYFKHLDYEYYLSDFIKIP